MVIILYTLCKDCNTKIPYGTTRCEECDSRFKEESNKRNNKNRYIRDKANYSYRLFYSSNDWFKKREEIYKLYEGHCVICRALGRYTVGQDVHHIIPLLKDFDKRLENDNLILVCSLCHQDIHRNNIDNEIKLNKYIKQKINSDKFTKKLLGIEN